MKPFWLGTTTARAESQTNTNNVLKSLFIQRFKFILSIKSELFFQGTINQGMFLPPVMDSNNAIWYDTIQILWV